MCIRDSLSSAHVYVRLPRGHTYETIPKEVVEECCQLTKHNSIQGVKESSVTIIYTPWSNLKKEPTMDVGQVSFHDNKKVVKCKNVSRNNTIINRLNKSKKEKEESELDLKGERENRDKQEINERKAMDIEKRKVEKENKEKEIKIEEEKSYKNIMRVENMKSNRLYDDGRSANEIEEDFF
eukprot:TRINITY_DN3975_c0_g1_i2.p1 TRINITY_DN3975_c0_g1~~TRINITY_DN3975_c0_g1_i2.p1  ORF type:complete len:181 (-),score=61.61 TRINITY_DN3975_c0_g1_i2:37-579(-)